MSDRLCSFASKSCIDSPKEREYLSIKEFWSSYSRVIFGRPKRDFVALPLLERALFACSREDVSCENALSLCPIPTGRSFRCDSDIVSRHQSLSQVYDFES
jgi:hypothetical protein